MSIAIHEALAIAYVRTIGYSQSRVGRDIHWKNAGRVTDEAKS
jgi:hypothetical protein